jgi:hypothetical protein
MLDKKAERITMAETTAICKDKLFGIHPFINMTTAITAIINAGIHTTINRKVVGRSISRWKHAVVPSKNHSIDRVKRVSAVIHITFMAIIILSSLLLL